MMRFAALISLLLKLMPGQPGTGPPFCQSKWACQRDRYVLFSVSKAEPLALVLTSTLGLGSWLAHAGYGGCARLHA